MKVVRGAPQSAFDPANLVDSVMAEIHVGEDGVLTIALPTSAPKEWFQYFTVCGFDSGPPWCFHLRLEHDIR